MTSRLSPHGYVTCILLLVLMVCAPVISANGRVEQLQQRIEALSQEAERTTDLNRLMQIQQELMSLTSELMSEMQGMPAIPMARGKTPQEEVDRVIESMNRGYRQVKASIGQLRGENQPLVPLSRAARLSGHILIRGHDEEPPYRGWVWIKLAYTVKESFVGYVVITEYYDPATGRMTDNIDYSLASISTNVEVQSVAGQQCLEASAGLPGHCTHWETITHYDIDAGNHYPSIHDWVIMGSSEDNVLKIKVQSPDVYFKSITGRAGRGLGCYGPTLEITDNDFTGHLKAGRYVGGQHLGHEFRGAPHCASGSTMEVNLFLCDPLKYGELDHCGQIASLMKDLNMVLFIRDAYREVAPLADDPDHLDQLVADKVNARFPEMDINLQDEVFLKKHTGGYAMCSGKVIIPDFCSGCIPAPYCEWQTDGLRVHENTHKQDLQGDVDTVRLFCDERYQMTYHPDVKKRGLLQVKISKELEYHAYNEQARQLLSIIQQQLSQSTGCALDPQFYVDLDNAMYAIE